MNYCCISSWKHLTEVFPCTDKVQRCSVTTKLQIQGCALIRPTPHPPLSSHIGLLILFLGGPNLAGATAGLTMDQSLQEAFLWASQGRPVLLSRSWVRMHGCSQHVGTTLEEQTGRGSEARIQLQLNLDLLSNTLPIFALPSSSCPIQEQYCLGPSKEREG